MTFTGGLFNENAIPAVESACIDLSIFNWVNVIKTSDVDKKQDMYIEVF